MPNSKPNNILFLRVGIDKGCGGLLSPIFSDGSFEYIPIPESPNKASARSISFNQLNARSGGVLAHFLPARRKQDAAHYDPEFETFTYGDPGKNKRSQLLRLIRNDYLVFYAGLTPHDFSGHDQLYIIGYFVINQIHEIPTTIEWPPIRYAALTNNAHMRRNSYDPGLVIAEGHPDRSRLLQRATPLSNESLTVLPELTATLGFTGSIMRAGAGRWVPPSHLGSVAAWLEDLD